MDCGLWLGRGGQKIATPFADMLLNGAPCPNCRCRSVDRSSEARQSTNLVIRLVITIVIVLIMNAIRVKEGMLLFVLLPMLLVVVGCC